MVKGVFQRSTPREGCPHVAPGPARLRKGQPKTCRRQRRIHHKDWLGISRQRAQCMGDRLHQAFTYGDRKILGLHGIYAIFFLLSLIKATGRLSQ